MKNVVQIFFVFFIFLQLAQATPCSTDRILEKVFLNDGTEVQLETLSLDLKSMSKNLINDSKNGKKIQYWIDSNDQLHFSNSDRIFKTENPFIIIQDKKTKNAFIIKEWGNFGYDIESRKVIYAPTNSWDLIPNEINDAIRKQSKLEFNRIIDPARERAQVLKCSKVLSERQRGETLFLDNLISSTTVTIAGFTTAEMVKPNNKSFKEKITLLGADLITGGIGSAVSSKVVKPLILNDASMIKDFTYRTGADLGLSLALKWPVYNFIDPEKEKKKNGTKLIPFDTGFGIVRFFPKRALDKWTMNTLPLNMFDLCLKNSSLYFIVGPRMIKTVDRYAWSLIYMSSRKSMVLNEEGK